MVKAAIYGASGYTGQELMRLLSRHPLAAIGDVTSRRYRGQSVCSVFPGFQGLSDLAFSDRSPREVAAGCDVVFLAVPHNVSMQVAPVFLEAGRKVIDLSADFRIRDPATYERWYGAHTCPELLERAVYGIPELYRSQIAAGTLVANPGCYPTSVILGLAPLLRGGLIDLASIIVDAKSGVSGAGREPQVGTLFCEVSEGFKAYNVARHRHTPEMEQELSRIAGQPVTLSFTPHLLPVSRGILSTIYARLTSEVTHADLLGQYTDCYRGEPFITLYGEGLLPNISSVRGTNYCHIGFVIDGRTKRVIVFSAIDNLVKGAAGQAVQNMNIMQGLDEETGLSLMPLFP